jgi:glycosyltransferase involved in cell wall biosynthesis
MLNKINQNITELNDERTFVALSKDLVAIDKDVYDDEIYKKNIELFYKEEYTYSYDAMEKRRKINLEEQPLVSIVLGTYNGEKYLEEQLSSLNSLEYTNLELIVSDDGSTDGTETILNSFDYKMPHLIVQNQGAHGVLGNFGHALGIAKGEYIALCDQDDIWKPDKIQSLLAGIEDYDIVFGRVKVIGADGQGHRNPNMVRAYEHDYSKCYRLVDYLYSNVMLGCASLIRSSLVKSALPIPPQAVFHDWWLVLNAVLKGKGICYLDKEVIKYRQHDDNAAKGFYNESSFQEKLLSFNELIRTAFAEELSHRDSDMVRIHGNWCYLYQLFMQVMPNMSYEYFHSNKFSLSNDALEILVRQIGKRIGDN